MDVVCWALSLFTLPLLDIGVSCVGLGAGPVRTSANEEAPTGDTDIAGTRTWDPDGWF